MKLRIICSTNATNPQNIPSTSIVNWFASRGAEVVKGPCMRCLRPQYGSQNRIVRVPFVPFGFFDLSKCRCYLFICKTVETFVFLHMCNPALSKLIFNLLTGRVSVQNYFRQQPRWNPSFIFGFVHTHSILSTHSIPNLILTILIHCAVTQWMS